MKKVESRESRVESPAPWPRFAALLAVLFVAAATGFASGYVEIPQSARHENYAGGSCLWAAAEDVLASRGYDDEARFWRTHFHGGANVPDLVAKSEARGLRYAYCGGGEESFLQWCDESGLPAAIHWQGGQHAVTFCGFGRPTECEGEYAYWIDNNRPAALQRLPRTRFLALWREAGGCAWTVLPAVTLSTLNSQLSTLRSIAHQSQSLLQEF